MVRLCSFVLVLLGIVLVKDIPTLKVMLNRVSLDMQMVEHHTVKLLVLEMSDHGGLMKLYARGRV